ncbi:hypothetical protein DPEC_G00257620 [Dallia pectoralis]|uniref:Uncharacterized protein n=1 Tax=Dallia pectoralis TaxID=75939 RepID=A0ACC2FR10_DALPE|nr:hypothetical protein DPEC_G00257620 [Dallia pectoralis]
MDPLPDKEAKTGGKVFKRIMEVEGKIATVTPDLSGNQLIHLRETKQSSVENHAVDVHHIEKVGDQIHMSFCFKDYFWAVQQGGEVELIHKNNISASDNRCMFRWNEKSGEWGQLMSVAEPKKYLCKKDSRVTVGQNYKKKNVIIEVDGKIATVEPDLDSGYQIHVGEVKQALVKNHAVDVYYLPGENKIVNMAFCFNDKYVAVQGDKVKLINEENICLPDKRFMFRWNEKSGEWGQLVFVAEPTKYLCKKDSRVTVGTKPDRPTIFRLTSWKKKL